MFTNTYKQVFFQKNKQLYDDPFGVKIVIFANDGEKAKIFYYTLS